MKKHRVSDPRMQHYRHVYRNSKLWLGDNLEGKTIIVYCEQGLGDNIQFLRYLPRLQERGCHVIVHCSSVLHPVLPHMGAKEWLDKEDENLPNHDYHVLSLDLPFILSDAFSYTQPEAMQRWWMGEHLDDFMPQINKNIPQPSYIQFTEKEELPEGLNIGICWSGNPNHHNDEDRSCYLKDFAHLKGRLISLQTEYNPKYTEGAENVELWGSEIKSILDTIRLINAVDMVISVDSFVMHLAGALNKKTICLLGDNPDPRWGKTSHLWYPSVTFLNKHKLPEIFVVKYGESNVSD